MVLVVPISGQHLWRFVQALGTSDPWEGFRHSENWNSHPIHSLVGGSEQQHSVPCAREPQAGCSQVAASPGGTRRRETGRDVKVETPMVQAQSIEGLLGSEEAPSFQVTPHLGA